MNLNLANRQRNVYQFTQNDKNAYSPKSGQTTQAIEIKKGEQIRSKALFSQNKEVESIKLSSVKTHFGIPLIGKIAAGKAIEAIATEDELNLGNVFNQKNLYALRVKGDSMIEEGIFDGDIVICEQSNIAKDGDIVVALIDNFEATLKRLKRYQENSILLIPANSNLPAMEYSADRVSIQGVFKGLIRLP